MTIENLKDLYLPITVKFQTADLDETAVIKILKDDTNLKYESIDEYITQSEKFLSENKETEKQFDSFFDAIAFMMIYIEDEKAQDKYLIQLIDNQVQKILESNPIEYFTELAKSISLMKAQNNSLYSDKPFDATESKKQINAKIDNTIKQITKDAQSQFIPNRRTYFKKAGNLEYIDQMVAFAVSQGANREKENNGVEKSYKISSGGFMSQISHPKCHALPFFFAYPAGVKKAEQILSSSLGLNEEQSHNYLNSLRDTMTARTDETFYTKPRDILNSTFKFYKDYNELLKKQHLSDEQLRSKGIPKLDYLIMRNSLFRLFACADQKSKENFLLLTNDNKKLFIQKEYIKFDTKSLAKAALLIWIAQDTDGYGTDMTNLVGYQNDKGEVVVRKIDFGQADNNKDDNIQGIKLIREEQSLRLMLKNEILGQIYIPEDDIKEVLVDILSTKGKVMDDYLKKINLQCKDENSTKKIKEWGKAIDRRLTNLDKLAFDLLTPEQQKKVLDGREKPLRIPKQIVRNMEHFVDTGNASELGQSKAKIFTIKPREKSDINDQDKEDQEEINSIDTEQPIADNNVISEETPIELLQPQEELFLSNSNPQNQVPSANPQQVIVSAAATPNLQTKLLSKKDLLESNSNPQLIEVYNAICEIVDVDPDKKDQFLEIYKNFEPMLKNVDVVKRYIENSLAEGNNFQAQIDKLQAFVRTDKNSNQTLMDIKNTIKAIKTEQLQSSHVAKLKTGLAITFAAAAVTLAICSIFIITNNGKTNIEASGIFKLIKSSCAKFAKNNPKGRTLAIAGLSISSVLCGLATAALTVNVRSKKYKNLKVICDTFSNPSKQK